MRNRRQVAVVGVTGYTGLELARILLRHPALQPIKKDGSNVGTFIRHLRFLFDYRRECHDLMDGQAKLARPS